MEIPRDPQQEALKPQTLSTALARHLTAAVRARLTSLEWPELLRLPFDGSMLVVRGLSAGSLPTPNDIALVYTSDESWPSETSVLPGNYEYLASFRFAINDLRGADEPVEEELAEDSPRLARYVLMGSDQMVDFLTCYASYLIEDYCKEIVMPEASRT